jgi:4-amino-4-deoxy-L-arabinose transferase-like glycosyltransferase
VTAAEFVRVQRGPFERLFEALIDPERCERTMALLLASYAVIWALYGTIARSTQDTHYDMGEMFAWSHEVGLSAPSHPPLGAWLVRAWFSVMPAVPWSYYLFAMILATAAIWIAWRVSARYLTAEKRAVGVILLTFIPFYNFHALKFNANTVLIPFWAATTWWFLRSFETRRLGWAALAGIGAAAAMLGKYWSFFLLAGLAVAAVTDPRRGAYFRSPAPWLTIAIGAIALAPHLVWLVVHHFPTVSFAFEVHRGTFASAAESAPRFIIGTLAYIAAPIMLGLLATQTNVKAIADTLWPATAERRLVVVAFAAPVLLAAVAAVPLRVELHSLWEMPAMILVPVVLLSSPLVTLVREAAVRLLALAVVFPLVMVAVSPAIAFIIHREGLPDYATHYGLIANAVEQAWRRQTDNPLRIVGSYRVVADGTNFYFAGRPSTFDITNPARTPWVDKSRIEREGIAIVCPEPETGCMQEMNIYAARYPAAATEEVILARRDFGTYDVPVRYRIVIIPPPKQ